MSADLVFTSGTLVLQLPHREYPWIIWVWWLGELASSGLIGLL